MDPTNNLTFRTIPEAYPALLQHVLTNGCPVSPRGSATLELIGPAIRITNPRENVVTSKERKLNLSFMAAELSWMLSGSNDARLVVPYNKKVSQFSDDGLTFRGAYGPHLMDQLPWVIQQLRDDPDTRQAVLTLWRPRPAPSKDIPCTVSMQFFSRQRERDNHAYREVDMVVYMRSNDLWLGFPYDIFNFTTIQQYVASALGLRLGEYHHHVGSMHLYEKDQEAARRVIQEPVSDQPIIINDTVTYPMPEQYLAMATAVSLLGGKAGGPQEMLAWLDAGAWNLTGFWGDMIELLGYRFHNQVTHLTPQYERLLTYHKGIIG